MKHGPASPATAELGSKLRELGAKSGSRLRRGVDTISTGKGATEGSGSAQVIEVPGELSLTPLGSEELGQSSSKDGRAAAPPSPPSKGALGHVLYSVPEARPDWSVRSGCGHADLITDVEGPAVCVSCNTPHRCGLPRGDGGPRAWQRGMHTDPPDLLSPPSSCARRDESSNAGGGEPPKGVRLERKREPELTQTVESAPSPDKAVDLESPPRDRRARKASG